MTLVANFSERKSPWRAEVSELFSLDPVTKQQVQYPGEKGTTSEKKERPTNHFVCKLEVFGKQNRGANFAAEKQGKNLKSALSSEKKLSERP